jgi:hypothetical protein
MSKERLTVVPTDGEPFTETLNPGATVPANVSAVAVAPTLAAR